MSKKNVSLMSDKSERIQSVENFNTRTLETLHYHGGYSTTSVLALIHQYTRAGVRKRMNAMVRQGWVTKIEHDEGLGRKEQMWAITKAGRIAAQTENDTHVDTQTLKGFSICEYSPALHRHTQLVQVIASYFSQVLNQAQLKPFKIEVNKKYKQGYIYPDIVFEDDTKDYLGAKLPAIEFYEVELTIKSVLRYKELFQKISTHNIRNSWSDDGFIISSVIYVTSPSLIERLRSILKNIPTDFDVYIFEYNEIINEKFNFDNSFVNQVKLTEAQLNKLGRF